MEATDCRMYPPPEVLWAQRSDKIYLTISLPDAKNVRADIKQHGGFSFSATGPQGEPFDFELELYGSVIPENSRVSTGLRNILCTIQKEEKCWWKRLLKSNAKPAPYIKVDWNKWCDEDEESTMSDVLASDDSDGIMKNDESSDDEGMLYLPDLEKLRNQ